MRKLSTILYIAKGYLCTDETDYRFREDSTAYICNAVFNAKKSEKITEEESDAVLLYIHEQIWPKNMLVPKLGLIGYERTHPIYIQARDNWLDNKIAQLIEEGN